MFIQLALSVGLLLISAASFSQPSTALTVSPGGLQEPTLIADACPTFSWGSVPGASGYELVVFQSLDDKNSSYHEHESQGPPVLEAHIAAPALSWTPGDADCLETASSYLWFVRALRGAEGDPWSRGRWFEVGFNAGTLADAIYDEVSTQLGKPEAWSKMLSKVLSSDPSLAPRLRVARKQLVTTVAEPTQVLNDPEKPTSTEVMEPRTIFPSSSAFRVASGRGVLFATPLNTVWFTGFEYIPAEGPGSRFMWYPRKTALRAGKVNEDQWDDDNIGIESVAVGVDTTASGDNSTAMGFNTTASGDYSTAMGVNTIAGGFSSTAVGSYSEATGSSSVALGRGTHANGINSTASGHFTIADGNNSTAMGDSTVAESAYETVIGYRDTDYNGSSSTWIDTDRLFVVGNGGPPDSGAPPSDAMVILKNGNTGIGVSDPEAPLQIDDGSDCSLGGGGYLITNTTGSANICIDDNEVLARNNGENSILYINRDGGRTFVGGNLEVYSWEVGGLTDVCRDGNVLSYCGSSQRYKEQIRELALGMSTVQALRPVVFKWNSRPGTDLGFIAEEVAKVDPLLVTHNDTGGVEGVKYKQLTAILVNAIKEQQQELLLQRSELITQRQEIAALREEMEQYRSLATEVAEIRHELAKGPQLRISYAK